MRLTTIAVNDVQITARHLDRGPIDGRIGMQLDRRGLFVFVADTSQTVEA